jgi:hypothetical protein
MFYARGMYFRKDLDAAARWLRAAARPGDLFVLAEAYKGSAEADPSIAPTCYPKATEIYLDLLKKVGHPEVRRAQMELGNFVIDGIYSAGNDPKARSRNLEWARMITKLAAKTCCANQADANNIENATSEWTSICLTLLLNRTSDVHCGWIMANREITPFLRLFSCGR